MVSARDMGVMSEISELMEESGSIAVGVVVVIAVDLDVADSAVGGDTAKRTGTPSRLVCGVDCLALSSLHAGSDKSKVSVSK